MTQQEYLDGMKTWADGERLVPEKFVGRINNVINHFLHWEAVCQILQPGTTIDVGCGCGMSSRIYSLALGAPVIAVDKPDVVKWSSVAYPTPGVKFVGCDLASQWDFGKFDNVVCIDVIEHIAEEHYVDFLKSLAGAGHRESKWILTTPIGEDNNPWHLRSWLSMRSFLDDVGRYIPVERIIRV